LCDISLFFKVATYFAALLPGDIPIVAVRQFRAKKTQTGTYDVILQTREQSEQLRGAFGNLLKSRAPGKTALPMPKELTGVTIAISHTFATRVRVRIMRQISKIHADLNKDLAVFVTNYLPRPNLVVRHPSGKRESFLYFEAVRKFGHYLSEEFLVEESNYAKGNIGVDNLQSVFLVLSSDRVQPGLVPTPQVGTKRGPEHLDSTASGQAPKKVSFTAPRGGKSRGGKGGRGGKRSSTSSATISTSNQFAALLSSSPATPLEKSFSATSGSVDQEANTEPNVETMSNSGSEVDGMAE